MTATEDKTMSSAAATAAEDLALIREIAEEGRMLPLQGGKYLVMWGIISAIGLSFTGAVVAGVLPLPGYSIMVLWLALSVFGGIMTGRWGRQGRGSTFSESVGNKVEAIVWSIAGFFMFLVSMMLFAMPLFAGGRFENAGIDPTVLFGMLSPLAFGLYAICLAATAVAGKASWLWRFVILSFVFAAMTLALVWDYKQFIAAVLGIIVVIVVPGLIMIDKNRKAQGQI